MAKRKYKYFFIAQEIRDGDREYIQKWCTTKFDDVTVEDVEKEYTVEHHEDIGVDVDDMEIYTYDPDVREITEEEYNILSNYI